MKKEKYDLSGYKSLLVDFEGLVKKYTGLEDMRKFKGEMFSTEFFLYEALKGGKELLEVFEKNNIGFSEEPEDMMLMMEFNENYGIGLGKLEHCVKLLKSLFLLSKSVTDKENFVVIEEEIITSIYTYLLDTYRDIVLRFSPKEDILDEDVRAEVNAYVKKLLSNVNK